MICYDYITDYIRNISHKSEGFLKYLEEFAQENKIPIIQPEVASFLTVLGNIIKPKKILEIGTAIGYSAILMSNFLDKDGIIDTIEISDKMVKIANENIKSMGIQNKVNIIEGDAAQVLKFMNETYDMIFLDAAKGQYPEFFKYCSKLLNKGGTLVCDNVLYKGMVATDQLVVRRKKTIVKRLRSFLLELSNDERFKTSILSIGDGVAISCKLTD